MGDTAALGVDDSPHVDGAASSGRDQQRTIPLVSLFRPLSPLSVLVAVATGSLIVATIVFPFARTADDSLFYLEVARNVANGNGFTFDGVTPTNGVQPLWQAIVVPIIAALEFLGLRGDVTQLRSLVGLNWLLLAATAFVLDRLLLQLRFSKVPRLLALLILLAYLGGPFALMVSEAHVVALALVVSLSLLHRLLSDPGAGDRHALGLGLALGLLMLGRLDTLFTAGAILLVLAVSRLSERTPWLRTVALAFCAASATVMPYLVLNLIAFDRITPVSGALKVDITSPQFMFAAVGIGWVILLAAAVVAAIAFLGRAQRPRGARLVAPLLVGALLSALYYFVGAQRLQTQWPWYFVPSVLALVIAAAAAAERVIRLPRPGSDRVRGALVAGVTGLFCIALIVFASGVPRSASQLYASESAQFAAELATIVPEGERIAVEDRPGILGYAGPRGIVAMDGLTQDFAFQSDLNELGAACTLQARGIRFFVLKGTDERRSVNITSWLSNERVGSFEFTPEQHRLTGGRPSMTLWELQPEEC